MAASRRDCPGVGVTEGAPAAGKSLLEVRLPSGSLIIVDADGERIGDAETVLEPGNRYMVAVEGDVADEVMNLLRVGGRRGRPRGSGRPAGGNSKD